MRVTLARTVGTRVLAAVGVLATAAGVAFGAAPRPIPAGDPIEDRYPRAAASYLVEIDGKIVWGRALDVPRPPASLAKLMTVLVVLDDGFDPGQVIPVSRRAAAQTSAQLHFRQGEGMTAGHLLDAALMASANDAAFALGEHLDGITAFVARMNRRARGLGLTKTHFVNPTGLDAKGQVSTARELLALTVEALAHPEIASRVGRAHATLTTTSGRRIEIASSNALLGLVDGVRGVKTGTTARAGECIIVLAERDGHRVVVILLGAKDRWWTSSALIEAAFREAGIVPTNLRTQASAIVWLGGQLVRPGHLNADPKLPVVTSWTPACLAAAATLAALLLLGFAMVRRRPAAALGILWFYLWLGPTNSFLPRLDVANDRQLYMALIGPGWLLGRALAR